jgi:shikimate kinase
MYENNNGRKVKKLDKNLILIGMPSAGKSTVGVILAKNLGMSFIDSDVLIQTMHGKLLQEILDNVGPEVFLEKEESAILSLDCRNTVVATGGSVVYSEKAMEHLKKNGIVVYIHIDMETVNIRLKNLKTRGVVLSKGQTLEDIYRKRKPLYEKYADIKVDCSENSIEETLEAIHNKLASLS